MDRSTVWAEIDSILATIDPNRASWVSLLDADGQLDGQSSAALMDFLVSLEDWAALNRLEDVIPAMLTHGFDCASFINGVIGEADLQEMGLKCPAVRRHMLSAVADLPRGIESVAASLTPTANVETFLQRLCLQQHLAADFVDLRHCLIDSLAGVTDSELREKYHIRKLGHRRRIIRCLNRLPPQSQKQPQLRMPDIVHNGDSISSSNSNNSCCNNGNSSGQSSTAMSASKSEDCSRSGSVAPVVEELLGPESLFRPDVKSDWPHHPDVLLGGSAAYSVSYLGFRPLENHTDRGEMGQVMQTFRCKSIDILKLPQICLSVCYLGVKFVNPDTEMIITEHSITDIYFACQDNTRRANFAYVTRDSVCGTHYCHCFASHSQDAAILIVNTLAEACSLANQLIEFNQLRGSDTDVITRRKRRTRHGPGDRTGQC